MNELLVTSVGLAVAVFVFVSMFSLGLDLTVRQIVDPLRDSWLLIRSLAANVLLVPLLMLTLTLLIPFDEPTRIGLVLYACCAGSEAAPKFVQIAKGSAAFAVALLGILLVVTVFGVPFLLSLSFPEAHIDQGKLLLKLLLVVALPLGLGLIIKARYDQVAARLSAVIHRIALVMLLLVFSLVVYANFDRFVALQLATLLAGLLLFFLAFIGGYLLGGPALENRRALALMTMARGGSISMVIAGQAFLHDPEVLVTASIMTALSVAIVVPLAIVMRRIAH